MAVVSVIAAGCSAETTRFAENPFAQRSTAQRPTPAAAEVTGSVPRAPAQRVQTQALPPPSAVQMSAPATRPAPSQYAARPQVSAPQPMPPAPSTTGQAANGSGWTWEGGTPITVRSGETVPDLAQRYRVPTAAILQANNLRPGQSLRPGQRLVIPRREDDGIVTGSAPPPRRPSMPPQARPQVSAPQTTATSPARSSAGRVHVVEAGDTLMRLTRIYDRSLSDIASANNMPTDAMLQIGQRITIPGAGGPQTAAAPQVRSPQPRQEPARQAQPQQPAPAPASVVQQNWPSENPAREEREVASARSATPVSHTPAAEQPRGQTADRGFRWPVRGRVIAGFGPRPNGQRNDGINVAVPEGTPVRAAEDGVIAYAGNELKSYGNLVLIRHDNGYVTAYAHASELMVKRDDKVRRGQIIARAGRTGSVEAPQLHFEVRKGSSPVDPMPFLERGGST